MLELFNEIMQAFQLFVSSFMNDLEFASGVSIGWILITIGCFAVIIRFLYGRLK